MVMTTSDNLRYIIAAFYDYNDKNYCRLLGNATRLVERFGEPQEAIRYLSALAVTIANSNFSTNLEEDNND